MVGVYWSLLAMSWSLTALPLLTDSAKHNYNFKISKGRDICRDICTCLGNYVDCSSKDLDHVPPDLPKGTSHLHLHNNAIKKMDDGCWNNLTNLMELKLNKNGLREIPKDAFTNLKRLKILELNHNHLRKIEALTFKSLEQLTALKLKRNQISRLEDGAFYGLLHIEKLILDYNKVEVISKGWVYGLENLKELLISHNRINFIEKGAWESCKLLTVLELSHNNLQSIGVDTFKYLGKLQKLFLNNNNITVIQENAFVHVPNLKYLFLSNNKISYIIEDANGVFQGLQRLLKFDIAGNNIKSINRNAFVGLSTVEHLNLNNNNITSVQKNAFAEMPYLNELVMNTTSLLCDCNLQWFSEFLQTKNYSVETVCAYPPWLRGKLLLEVPAENFTCDELPKPRIIEEPDLEIMALKGENISLSCKAMSSSNSEMNFRWKKDDVELPIVKVKVTKTMDSRNTEFLSELFIQDVQHSDAGKYQCVVSNNYGSTYSQKSSISVLIFPSFKRTPANITIQAGETAKLECAAEGEPHPEIRWQKDGGNDFPAARERRMHVMTPNDYAFFIINAKPTDMGVYSCTARNPAGTIVANATLTVYEKPFFAKRMENKEVVSGSPVVLECMAGGTPKPAVTWLKDGRKVKVTERHFFTAEDQLMIIVDTVQSDSGTYECHLNNSLGEVLDYSNLTVTSDDTIMGIIIITVACCAVLTSCVWVIIIYHTRKRMLPTTTEVTTGDNQAPLEFTDPLNAQFADNVSDQSSCKDSGTGDSAKRSNDDLVQEEGHLTENVIPENADGTEKNSRKQRAASLVYLVEGGSPNTPLLHYIPKIHVQPSDGSITT